MAIYIHGPRGAHIQTIYNYSLPRWQYHDSGFGLGRVPHQLGSSLFPSEGTCFLTIRSIDLLYTFQPAIWEGIGTMVEARKNIPIGFAECLECLSCVSFAIPIFALIFSFGLEVILLMTIMTLHIFHHWNRMNFIFVKNSDCPKVWCAEALWVCEQREGIRERNQKWNVHMRGITTYA